jgi:hypothetical protein
LLLAVWLDLHAAPTFNCFFAVNLTERRDFYGNFKSRSWNQDAVTCTQRSLQQLGKVIPVHIEASIGERFKDSLDDLFFHRQEGVYLYDRMSEEWTFVWPFSGRRGHVSPTLHFPQQFEMKNNNL